MTMQRAIFLDIDGTLTTTVSGETFKQHPRDVAVLPGVKEALEYYHNQFPKWLMMGISNQGGVAAGYKSIEDAIAEMQYTLELLPQLNSIYFCPDFDGLTSWKITTTETLEIKQFNSNEYVSFRKPGAGMVNLAVGSYQIEKRDSWYIGDRPEDEQCATAAGISYMDADIWRDRFRTGMYEVKPATIKQVRFLESLKLSNDN